MCVCVSVYVELRLPGEPNLFLFLSMCGCPRRTEESVRCSGGRVTGSVNTVEHLYRPIKLILAALVFVLFCFGVFFCFFWRQGLVYSVYS